MLTQYPSTSLIKQYLQKTNREETSSEVGWPNLFLWRPGRNKQISMKLSFDGQSACSLIFRIRTNYPFCWSDICQHKFIVQGCLFTSPNGKLIGCNKRRKRNIIAGNLHALFVHIWILVCYQVLTCSEDWKTVFKHLTRHIPPHTTSYTFSTYGRLLMRSEVLRVELLTLQTYFMTIDI